MVCVTSTLSAHRLRMTLGIIKCITKKVLKCAQPSSFSGTRISPNALERATRPACGILDQSEHIRDRIDKKTSQNEINKKDHIGDMTASPVNNVWRSATLFTHLFTSSQNFLAAKATKCTVHADTGCGSKCHMSFASLPPQRK